MRTGAESFCRFSSRWQARNRCDSFASCKQSRKTRQANVEIGSRRTNERLFILAVDSVAFDFIFCRSVWTARRRIRSGPQFRMAYLCAWNAVDAIGALVYTSASSGGPLAPVIHFCTFPPKPHCFPNLFVPSFHLANNIDKTNICIIQERYYGRVEPRPA